MTSSGIAVRVAAGAVLIAASGISQAQSMGYYMPEIRPQFYLGGAVGGSIFSERRSQTQNALDSIYTPAHVAPGDYVASYSDREDDSDIGAKVYGGAWLTPNLGVEAGFAYLGRFRWSGYTADNTGAVSIQSYGHVSPHAWYEALLLGANVYGVRYYLKGGAYEASTNLEANSFNDNTGAAFGPSTSVHNTNGLAGIGLTSGYGHVIYRLEVEDFINVGTSTIAPSTAIVPWRGNVVLISAGVNYEF